MDKNFEKALEFYKNGEIEQSEDLCNQALKKNPNNANVLNLLGVITWRQGAPEKGAELMEKAIAQNSEKTADFSCNLALLYISVGKILEAANCYKTAAEEFYRKANMSEAMLALQSGAYLLRDHHMFEKAKTFYQTILQINPNHLDALNDMGLILQEENNLEGAIDSFKKALSIDPTYSNAYHNLGALFQTQKRPKEAALLYEKNLELDPNSFEAHLNLGNIYREEEKLEKALEHTQKALNLEPNHPGIHNNIGLIYHQKGDREKAEFHLKKALELDPSFDVAEQNLKALSA